MCSNGSSSKSDVSPPGAQQVSIRIRGLSKAYHVYAHPQQRLWQMLWPGKERKFYRDYLAMRNVDLDLFRGETVGIVGRNGAGKSTLLKVICGALDPTSGEIDVAGQIAPLLMIGAGFNPEFTGRENAILNASILGLSEKQIGERLDEVIAFADIGEFFDQPVKNYSSGMYSRLAFSIAINTYPDILVVDEILAVGDEAFTRKCFARIEEIKKRGATILFVSHSAGAVIDLCDRAVLMEAGERILTADPKTVISYYQRLLYAPKADAMGIVEEIRALDAGDLVASASTGAVEPSTPGPAPGAGNTSAMIAQEPAEAAPIGDPTLDEPIRPEPSPTPGEAMGFKPFEYGFFDPNLCPETTVEYVGKGTNIENARILDPLGRRVNVLASGGVYTFAYRARFSEAARRVRFGMMTKLITGTELGGQASHSRGEGIERVEAGTSVDVCFKFRATMAPGSYFLNAGVLAMLGEEEQPLCRVLDIAMFRLAPIDRGCVTGRVDITPRGSSHDRAEWAISLPV